MPAWPVVGHAFQESQELLAACLHIAHMLVEGRRQSAKSREPAMWCRIKPAHS
jgi:hypothetical protein